MRYKHDYDKTLFRLTQIIAKLYNGSKLSQVELANEFGVSTKTIQRDFAKLVILYPIYQENKLWKLKSDFEFKEYLSLEDEITLKLLLQASKSFDKTFQNRAEKLLSRIDENISSPIYAKIELEDISNKLTELTQIESAISMRNKIQFTYLKDDFYYDTIVDPYKIVNFDGFWYLIAKRNGNLRKYYLQQVFDIEILQETFKKFKKIENLIQHAINIWFDDNNGFEVELLIDVSIAKYFQRKPIAKSQRYKETDEEGNMTITLHVTHKNEIIPIVKYWLPNIKVLSPIELQKEIQADIENFLS